MTESAQIGFFPGLLEPAIKTAELIMRDPQLEQCEIDGMSGFWVSRVRVDLSDRTLHAFTHNEQQFIIFQ